MIVPADELVPSTPDDVVGAVREAGGAGGELALLTSAMCFSGKRRIAVLTIEPLPPKLLFEGFVAREGLDMLTYRLSTLGHLHKGSFDAMYAVGGSVVWWHVLQGLVIWSEVEGQVGLARPGVLELRGSRYPAETITDLEVWTDDRWVFRALRLRPRQGEPITIVSEEDEIALVDPTYDFIQLDCETAWMQRLGRDLAAMIGCAYVERLTD